MHVQRMFRFVLGALLMAAMIAGAFTYDRAVDAQGPDEGPNVQLGPRPFYLVNDMDEGDLKTALEQCTEGPFHRTTFSIGHRGASLMFPEHTRESYMAANRMGAGIIECDVTFTADRQLVCRHSQCDLQNTTNILAVPELAAKCSQPFKPAVLDPETGAVVERASAVCCTSDITLEEFKMLRGKMDAYNPAAQTVEEYMGGTPDWRTDLYAANSGTLMTHAESIALFKEMGVKMTPELKTPSVEMPYEGDYTQQQFAQQMIDEYVAAGVPPENVFPQSFLFDDILYWLENDPEFGAQAVYLDPRSIGADFNPNDASTFSPTMQELADQGVQIIAPPMQYLVTLDENNNIVPSEYAKSANEAGLGIITWTLERSGPLTDGGGGYYQTVTAAINNSGDTYNMLDVLAQDVGIMGIFSDWAATVTYYANCMGID